VSAAASFFVYVVFGAVGGGFGAEGIVGGGDFGVVGGGFGVEGIVVDGGFGIVGANFPNGFPFTMVLIADIATFVLCFVSIRSNIPAQKSHVIMRWRIITKTDIVWYGTTHIVYIPIDGFYIYQVYTHTPGCLPQQALLMCQLHHIYWTQGIPTTIHMLIDNTPRIRLAP
jgi:hypothetical protein